MLFCLISFWFMVFCLKSFLWMLFCLKSFLWMLLCLISFWFCYFVECHSAKPSFWLMFICLLSFCQVVILMNAHIFTVILPSRHSNECLFIYCHSADYCSSKSPRRHDKQTPLYAHGEKKFDNIDPWIPSKVLAFSRKVTKNFWNFVWKK